MFEEQKDKSQIYTLINSIAVEHNLSKKLRMFHILMHSIDKDVAKKVKGEKYHQKMHQIFSDVMFMQQLKLNSELKEHPDSAIEYLGKDYRGGDENLQFKPEFEAILDSLQVETDELLGEIIKEYAKSEEGLSFSSAVET
jgi:hypothetical protein